MIPGLGTPTRLRGLRHGLWLGAAMSMVVAAAVVTGSRFGVDAHAYWSAWQRPELYAIAPQHVDAYEYSPAFAQAIRPLALLPWPAFCVLWTAAIVAIYMWLLAPLELRWRLPLLLLCSPDIVSGNIWSLFALVLVFGFRAPAAWSLPLLTKVTPVVGPVWFAARREWRALALALGAMLAIAAASFAIDPGAWRAWARFLADDGAGASTTARTLRPLLHPPTALYLAVVLPAAIAVTVVAARSDRPWLLPVAMLLATPFFTVNAFATLTAIPRIRDGSSARRRAGAPARRRRRTGSAGPALPGRPARRPSRRPA